MRSVTYQMVLIISWDSILSLDREMAFIAPSMVFFHWVVWGYIVKSYSTLLMVCWLTSRHCPNKLPGVQIALACSSLFFSWKYALCSTRQCGDCCTLFLSTGANSDDADLYCYSLRSPPNWTSCLHEALIPMSLTLASVIATLTHLLSGLPKKLSSSTASRYNIDADLFCIGLNPSPNIGLWDVTCNMPKQSANLSYERTIHIVL